MKDAGAIGLPAGPVSCRSSATDRRAWAPCAPARRGACRSGRRVGEERLDLVEHVWPQVGERLERLMGMGMSGDREEAVVALPRLLLRALADLQHADHARRGDAA